MLASFKSSLTQDKKHYVLKNSLDVLSTQICDLKSENASLQRDVVTLKERVFTFKASANSGKSSSQCTEDLPHLLLEL